MPAPLSLKRPPAARATHRIGPGLDDAAGLEHADQIRLLDGREPVGDEQHRAARHQLGEALLHFGLRALVER